MVDGTKRVTMRAKAQWVNTVLDQFTKGQTEGWLEYHVEEGEPSILD